MVVAINMEVVQFGEEVGGEIEPQQKLYFKEWAKLAWDSRG